MIWRNPVNVIKVLNSLYHFIPDELVTPCINKDYLPTYFNIDGGQHVLACF